jgi:hypothetical protein
MGRHGKDVRRALWHVDDACPVPGTNGRTVDLRRIAFDDSAYDKQVAATGPQDIDVHNPDAAGSSARRTRRLPGTKKAQPVLRLVHQSSTAVVILIGCRQSMDGEGTSPSPGTTVVVPLASEPVQLDTAVLRLAFG